jgi:MinD superfamily P-loop ATPase
MRGGCCLGWLIEMRQMVVISGKGGTGKTTVTAALAQLLEPVVLADCDVEAPNLRILFPSPDQHSFDIKVSRKAAIDPEKCSSCGLCAEHCRFKAIASGPPFQVVATNCEGCGVCALVCPSEAVSFRMAEGARVTLAETFHGPLVEGSLAMGEEASGKVVTRVRMEAQAMAAEQGFELIIIDGSPGIGCPVIASLSGADLALVVTEPTLSGWHDLERILQVTSHFSIPAMACLNKCDLNAQVALDIARLCDKRGVRMAAKIPFNPEVVDVLRRGLPPIGNVPAEVESPLRELASAVTVRMGI